MYKVNETRKRSLLKATCWRGLEIGATTALLYFWGKLEPQIALGLAIVCESACFGLHFGFERLWNRTQWGRQIIEVRRKRGRCKTDEEKELDRQQKIEIEKEV